MPALENGEIKLLMVKQRLDMMPGITARDDYLTARIQAVEKELERMGIQLQANDNADLMLLTDYVAWSFANRDKPGARPGWLTAQIRERWMHRDTE